MTGEQQNCRCSRVTYTQFIEGEKQLELNKISREEIDKLIRDANLELTFTQYELLREAIERAYIRGAFDVFDYIKRRE